MGTLPARFPKLKKRQLVLQVMSRDEMVWPARTRAEGVPLNVRDARCV